ncbi:MAG: prepilin-type N-terminal cleavage/methylation domain-containing protein [Verrucomicrobiota bacterium]
MRECGRFKKGFTLIELVVVVAIIGILVGLLIPMLSYGKFRARVTTCANNYRQLTLAAALYAGEDSRGRLPSFVLPTESSQLVKFQNLSPWLIGLPMLTEMETRGITPQMWYCPLRKTWLENSTSFRAKFGRPLDTAGDLTKFFTVFQNSKYGFLDLNWWVPRSLAGSSTLTYPDVSLLRTRLNTPWPSKMDDATISTRPIVSDWMTGNKEISGDSFASASGAHTFGGRIRNINSGYADGHLETRSAGNIRWELQLTDGKNSYIFY